MNKELQIQLKDNLIITSLDGEGLVFEADTRKTFWVNETAAFLMKLLEENNGGVPLSSLKSLLRKHYLIEDGNGIARDFASFVNQLEAFGLTSLQPSLNGSNGAKLKNPSSRAKKSYLKPIIEEERIVRSARRAGGISPMGPSFATAGPGYSRRRGEV